ncbi:filamentous hemagglutinin N-terminal domain-containing protein [Haemophilus influenzae]|uniref:two-partner secretion domain-containing protein n=2 Tax=Haemophilus influenzae TaxID=727 RepID=UPI003D7D963B
MNKIYRLKFSKRLNALVAVSELTRGCDHSTEKGSEKPVRTKVRHLALKPLSAMLLSLGVTSIPQSVLASGLQGMDVVHGTATMQVDGNKTIIRNSVDAIINWKQFNINQNEMVQFLQENNNSAVFNRVTSNQISQLKGILDSNGQVFLINPNGVAIGKNAIINTNGFTASTLDISNENIKARNFTFEQTKDKALAEIVNHGLITVGKDGSVNLIGGKVKNEGVISVNGGSISLLAGQKITISDIINPTITYSIAAPENEAINLGDIFAKGGNINVRAANIRNQGKLSADSVSKDKSGNIVLSAKEGEAEIGGVISAQNQQAKGGKLMITGDKVTLKTGAVIDLSGKEGGETYLGGDERGEGKNGIQLAKKTTLEKGSTINVSGKEKGGRAIVWGDIALIDGNINAQGSDIAKTGGFVETSGHDLFIGDNVIVDAKEWLLDPDNVSIDASTGRNNTSEDDEYPSGTGITASNPKVNDPSKPTLTNTTLERILKRGHFVNITAKKHIYVNSSINIGNNGHLILWSEGKNGGIQINEDITSTGGSLTIDSKGWVDIHKNITLGTGYLNITSKDSVAFEGKVKARSAASAQITAQGTIRLTGENKTFRLNNLSLNGTGSGLNVISAVGNLSHNFDGEINVSGNVTINQTVNNNLKYWQVTNNSHWNVSSFNLKEKSTFTFVKFVNFNNRGDLSRRQPAGVIFQNHQSGTNFNVSKGSTVNFTLKPNEGHSSKYNDNPIRFKSNISVTGGGEVKFNLLSNLSGGGVDMSMNLINVSNGSKLIFNSSIRGRDAFRINKDLIINATCSTFKLEQRNDLFGNNFPHNAISTSHNITILGGEVTLGGNGSSSNISGNINISEGANVTIQADNYISGSRKLTLGNISTQGNLSLIGTSVDIRGNLSVKESAIFKGETKDNLNITGTFTNNGTSEINIKQGAVNIQGNIINEKSLSITTNAKGSQKTIIGGNITNKKGDLNITNKGSNTEIQIGGNISQKDGNLTISSDKVNITKQITIEAGVDGGGSSSSTASDANLTIKTKELTLTDNLNISGFNKAEITAKDNSDLIIGKASSDNSNAKKVTFDKVKDSKISAGNHNVTLNSKVETSNSDSGGENGSNDNNAGLTVTAKNVTVNNNITSQNVTVTAKENLVTAENAVINATSGTVNISTKTGDIKGGIESASGSVNITASGDTLKVSNITGQDVTVTANAGALTTTEGSTINATANSVDISVKEGDLKGAVEAKKNSVNITAKENDLTVSNVTAKDDVTVKAEQGILTTTSGGTIKSEESKVKLTAQSGSIIGNVVAEKDSVTVTANAGKLSVANITGKTATLTAESGKLTTQAGSTIIGTESVTTSSQSGDISGTISGNTVSVKATSDLITQSGSKIEAKSGEANVTSATGTIDGTVSGKTVNVTASSGGLTVGGGARIKATEGAATLTATKGTLTTNTGSSITSTKGQVDLSAQDGSIAGQISAANVTLNTTGTLTTVVGSSINANEGTLVINAQDATLNGDASGNSTVVNATNASGSGSVTAKTSSSVNITGDLNTVNGLNIISKDGRNTVRLRGKEIEVKYIQPGVASVEEVIEAKRVLEKVKDLSDEERETLAKLGVSAVRFIEPNNTITVNTQNEFTTRPSSQVTISEGKACFSSGNGAAVCTNVADDGQQ